MYKRIIASIFAIITMASLITGCAAKNQKTQETTAMTGTYQQISQDEAKKIMDARDDYIIVDARDQYEYDEGHIKDAIVIPYTEIEAQAKQKLPNKEQLILVYCRSGRRSKIAARSLADMGYTNVKEFGGIIDWQYEIEK
ncbi:MAG: rhodanese-like domain-containing protein [Eubacterium sp.]